MRTALAATLILSCAVQLAAAPVLDEGRRTAVGWTYPDHADRNLWWLPPPAPQLVEVGGRPGVDFTVFNYQGARATADSGSAWTGAMLQFTLTVPDSTAAAAAARRVLGPSVELRTMASAGIHADVVFAGVNSVRSAGGSDDDEAAGAWRERSFSLGLTPEEVAVIHDAWQAGAVILSVNTSVDAQAFATKPEDEEANPEIVTVTVDSVTVAIDVDRYPETFRVLQLDATMPLGYTSLELGCAELTEGWGLDDLSMVVAVAEAEAVNGDVISKKLRFTRRSAAAQELSFDRAVRLDHGYLLRVVRIYASGLSEEAPPRRIDVWQGFEDICSSPPGDATELDPRRLY
jgi:hypothetical protein